MAFSPATFGEEGNVSSRLKIEEAVPADVSSICTMVRDLAEYEGLVHTLAMTEEMLSEALFGPNPAARALMARFDHEAAGFAAYYYTFSTFTGRRGMWLEDLYVKRSFRRQGIGSSLLGRVAAIAHREECGRLEWSALHWNEPAIRLYGRAGAKQLSEWDVYRLEGEEIAAAARTVPAAAPRRRTG